MGEPAPEQVNILLVDDRPENLLALRATLDRPEYRLFTAHSGKEALRLVLEEEFAVILLDVLMPEMDGYEVAHHLKLVERTRSIPILFCTAVATDVSQIYRAYDVGAVDYLIKPLDEEVVRKKVEVFVALTRQRREIERQGRLLREAQRREYELKLAELRVASDRRYRKLVEGIDHAIAWTSDLEGRLTFVSRQAPRILGFPPEEFLAADFWGRHLHPEDRSSFFRLLRQAIESPTARDLTTDFRLIAADGSVRWFHTGASAELSGPGAPEVHGISVEVTDIVRAAEAQTLLAETGRFLSESLEYQTNLERLAKSVLPVLGDWCLIDEVTPAGALRELAAAHVDPAREADLQALERCYAAPAEAAPGTVAVVRTGRPELHRDLSDPSALAEVLGVRRPEQLAALGGDSCLIVPLAARGRVLGVMSLVSVGAARRLGDRELALAEEVARRAALAIDNALLFEEARRATRAREDLLGIVSHDLRNPLGTILMGAGKIERSAPATPEATTAARMLRAAKRMERLIGDLLDFAELQAGALRVQSEANEASSLIRESIEALTPTAEEKHIQLELQVEEGLEVWCDRDRALQILANLGGNAIKFTPEGGTVALRAARQEDEGKFEVTDTGPGIEPEQLRRIWEPYWQSEKKPGGGVGLGLHIVRGLVEAHGGRIWAESTPGAGASFFFTLPLATHFDRVDPPAVGDEPAGKDVPPQSALSI